MLSELAQVKGGLRKSQVRVTGVDGRCHIEDSTGVKVEEVAVIDVRKAVQESAQAAEATVIEPPCGQRLTAPAPFAHGSKGDPKWPMPTMTKFCEGKARPGYHSLQAHEYLDEDEVLHSKVRLLASMMRDSKKTVAYTGAGISVTAGIPDWATKHGDNSATHLTVEELAKVAASAQPTLAHRVLTAANSAGLLHKWVQQNHDGLPQKAGFPQSALNEIHGAIFDPSNPIVSMSGKIRNDMLTDRLHCERTADLVLALGTSLAGMQADQLVGVVADRARRGKAIGVVIIALQQTVRDEDAVLRIFAPLDRVAALLAQELQLQASEMGTAYSPSVPAECKIEEDTYSVLYDDDGRLIVEGGQRGILDLSMGATVRIVDGPEQNSLAKVEGRNEEGHYQLRKQAEEQVVLLGSWWIEAAVLGTTPYIPVSSALSSS